MLSPTINTNFQKISKFAMTTSDAIINLTTLKDLKKIGNDLLLFEPCIVFPWLAPRLDHHFLLTFSSVFYYIRIQLIFTHQKPLFPFPHHHDTVGPINIVTGLATTVIALVTLWYWNNNLHQFIVIDGTHSDFTPCWNHSIQNFPI